MGSKKNAMSYQNIFGEIQWENGVDSDSEDEDMSQVLFISDSTQELEAADEAGFQTLQSVREDTVGDWDLQLSHFADIAWMELNNHVVNHNNHYS